MVCLDPESSTLKIQIGPNDIIIILCLIHRNLKQCLCIHRALFDSYYTIDNNTTEYE